MKKQNSKRGLKKILAVGDLRTTGAVETVVNQYSTDKTLLVELVRLIDDPDPGTRMRAFDALEKMTSANECRLTQKQIEKIFDFGFECEQQEVLWHWCQIIPRLKLTHNQMEEAFSRMNSLRGSKSKIVWTFALQGMFDLAALWPSLKTQAISAIEEDMKNGSAAVKSRCRLLLKNS